MMKPSNQCPDRAPNVGRDKALQGLKSKRGTAPKRGATAVEFAIVAPVVFLMFFASLEFCRVAMIRHTADNAVYEGARRAMVPGGTATDASDQAALILSSFGVNHVNISVTPATITRSTPEVTVRVRIPLDSNSFVPNQFFAGQTIERELTMQREGTR